MSSASDQPLKTPGKRAKHRPRKSTVLIVLNLAIVLLVGGGTAAYGALSQTVTLTVDGKSQNIRTFGGTVADVLEDHAVTVRPGDRVNKAVTSGLSDGDTIEVAYAKPITLTLDGKKSTRTVYDRTVDDALGSLGVAQASGSYVSAERSTVIPRAGTTLVVSTPKALTIIADGKKKTVTTTTPKVAGVLKEAGVSVDKDDEVKPAQDAYVTADDKVRVVRIKKITKNQMIALKHETVVRKDADALVGETEVVREGRNGKARQRVELVYADGKLRKKAVVSSDPVAKPVAKIVSRGTKRPPIADTDGGDGGGGGGSATGNTVWDKIAQCESGGNWSINTGNGYYGGLQFSAATWKSVGGPGLPHQNSREVQIKYAKILQARSGWGQWGCAGARFN
ncbi:resuscitation-promoting factor [Aeromicrobium chenweiae]|uniref:resuscitation-promoting factor n=1 Tax=Aeromicrobium chenweiae TaxID=2079793 RepID=UPI00131F065D|nr:resuscitation-promoting factor [Aeromicrobium chenweiae]